MSTLKNTEYLETQAFKEVDAYSPDKFYDLLSGNTEKQTRQGFRNYGILCVASKDADGNEVIVKKDHFANSFNWLVARKDAESKTVIFETVLGVEITNTEDGDLIELELASDVAYQGPYKLSFSVDSMYQRDGNPVTISHQKYYGRGVGETPEHQIDYEFAELIGNVAVGVTGGIDNIVDLDSERVKRRYVGYTAIAGF